MDTSSSLYSTDSDSMFSALIQINIRIQFSSSGSSFYPNSAVEVSLLDYIPTDPISITVDISTNETNETSTTTDSTTTLLITTEILTTKKSTTTKPTTAALLTTIESNTQTQAKVTSQAPFPSTTPIPTTNLPIITTAASIDSGSALSNVSAISGVLQVAVLWLENVDLDLNVYGPNEDRIYWLRTSNTATGGRLQIDNTGSGSVKVENIYFTKPVFGHYRLVLAYYGPYYGPVVPYQLIINNRGNITQIDGSISFTFGAYISGEEITQFDYDAQPVPAGSITPSTMTTTTYNYENELNSYGATSGILQVSILWTGVYDIDLNVYEPSGNCIYWLNRSNGPTQGNLQSDNLGSNTGVNVEHIYWNNPASGHYNVTVAWYGPPSGQVISFTIVISQDGVVTNQIGSINYNPDLAIIGIQMTEFDFVRPTTSVPPTTVLGVTSESTVTTVARNESVLTTAPIIDSGSALSNVSAISGVLQVAVLWLENVDLDLNVYGPNEDRIYWLRTSNTATGGRLQIDNTGSGSVKVENIYFTKPVFGHYRLVLAYYGPYYGPVVPYQLIINNRGNITQIDGSISFTFGAYISGEEITQFDYDAQPVPAGSITPSTMTTTTYNYENELNSYGATSGILQVSILWTGVYDIDLNVYEPSGNCIYWLNRSNGPTQGNLQSDNLGSNTGVNVEHIYWNNPASGHYNVTVAWYGPPSGQVISFTIVISQDGVVTNQIGSINYNPDLAIIGIQMTEFDFVRPTTSVPPTTVLGVTSESTVTTVARNESVLTTAPIIDSGSALSNVSAISGVLQVAVLWLENVDLDLNVYGPNEDRIYWLRTSNTATGGRLQIDNTGSGSVKVENIYFTKPVFGHYRLVLAYYGPYYGPVVPYQLIINNRGNITQIDGSISFTFGAYISGEEITQFDYDAQPVPAGSITPSTMTTTTYNYENELNSYGATSGILQVSILWTGVYDIDLNVYEPSGNCIYWLNRSNGPTQGNLQSDNLGSNTGVNVEHIYWNNPASGHYNVTVAWYGPPSGQVISFTIVISQDGVVTNQIGSINYNPDLAIIGIQMTEFDFVRPTTSVPPTTVLGVTSESTVTTVARNESVLTTAPTIDSGSALSNVTYKN